MGLCCGSPRQPIQEEQRHGLEVRSVGLILKGEVWIGWRAVCIKINRRSPIVEFGSLSVVYTTLLEKGVIEGSR